MQVMFQTLPKTAEEFISMPEFGFTTPFQVAALFIVAICAYPENRNECYNMIDALKGPQKLSGMEKQFIRDRMMGKAEYIGKAYFTGATPENNYTPDHPYTVVVEESANTYAEHGYAKVFLRTNGADSPRPVKLRKKGENWFLWEHTGPLSDIRIPRAQDPWA